MTIAVRRRERQRRVFAVHVDLAAVALRTDAVADDTPDPMPTVRATTATSNAKPGATPMSFFTLISLCWLPSSPAQTLGGVRIRRGEVP